MQWRIIILRMIVVLATLALLGRLYQLQIQNNPTERYSMLTNTTIRYSIVTPRRGQIYAADGATLLAQSTPSFSIAVRPGSLPPVGTQQRAEVLARLAQLADVSATLTISPALDLHRAAELRDALAPHNIQSTATRPISVPIAAEAVLDTMRLAWVYSDLLTLDNPLDTRLQQARVPSYETVVVKELVPRDVALTISENSAYMPGVVVEEDFQRIYPQSGGVPSLSHLLGYMGRIGPCELVQRNPAANWVLSLRDVLGSSPECGIVTKDLAINTTGIARYANDDLLGKDGLEGAFEDDLRGQVGVEMLTVDVLQRPIGTARTLHPVVDGNNLILTLDLTYQSYAETILRNWIQISEERRQSIPGHIQQYEPVEHGVAVVLDVRDGRVLAMASLPAYDNNVWVDRSRSAELQALLSPADVQAQAALQRAAPLTNRAIAGRYPIGSTLKPFVAAAALDAGVVQADTLIRDPGRLVLREREGEYVELPNSLPADNGMINLYEAMRVSSNVYFATVAGGNLDTTNVEEQFRKVSGLRIGGLTQGLDWFGFGKPTTIQLLGESGGRVPSPAWKAQALRQPWTTGDTYNTSIGQGYFEATPLQLVTAIAAIANGGTLYRPQLVQMITDSSNTPIWTYSPEELGRIPVSAAHLEQVRVAMRRSITDGFSVAARNECSGLSIAGKTGTAEYGPLYVGSDGKLTRQSHAWFVGFAPYEDPQIAAVVVLEGAGDVFDGSASLAAPAVTQLLQAYFGVESPYLSPECPLMPDYRPAPLVLDAAAASVGSAVPLETRESGAPLTTP